MTRRHSSHVKKVIVLAKVAAEVAEASLSQELLHTLRPTRQQRPVELRVRRPSLSTTHQVG